MSEQTKNTALESWPELKGKTYAEAEKYLKENHPDMDVVKKVENEPLTMDLRRNRVRVIVDNDDRVIAAPMTG